MSKFLNSLDIFPYGPKVRKNRTEVISLVVGPALFILGLSGLPFSNFMGLHLSVFHCLTITAAGVVLFWNGYLANEKGSYWACFGFGTFFALRAALGFLFGQHGVASLGSMEDRVFRIVPNFQVLGTADYILDALLCLILLAGAYDWSSRGRVSRAH